MLRYLHSFLLALLQLVAKSLGINPHSVADDLLPCRLSRLPIERHQVMLQVYDLHIRLRQRTSAHVFFICIDGREHYFISDASHTWLLRKSIAILGVVNH
jgi:hypothetical protein